MTVATRQTNHALLSAGGSGTRERGSELGRDSIDRDHVGKDGKVKSSIINITHYLIDFTSVVTAMFSVNRLGLYAVISTILVVILLHFRTFTRPEGPAGISLPPGSIYQLPPKTDPTKFDWAQRQQRYPVEKFIQLPVSSAQHLPQIQYAFDKTESHTAARGRKQRLAEVKSAMTRSWAAYRMHAWLSDELLPVSGGSKNNFGGWAATYVHRIN